MKPRPPIKKPEQREAKTPKTITNVPLKGHPLLFKLKQRLERENA